MYVSSNVQYHNSLNYIIFLARYLVSEGTFLVRILLSYANDLPIHFRFIQEKRCVCYGVMIYHYFNGSTYIIF